MINILTYVPLWKRRHFSIILVICVTNILLFVIKYRRLKEVHEKNDFAELSKNSVRSKNNFVWTTKIIM